MAKGVPAAVVELLQNESTFSGGKSEGIQKSLGTIWSRPNRACWLDPGVWRVDFFTSLVLHTQLNSRGKGKLN